MSTKPSVASEGTPVYVTITDFLALTAGTAIEFHLAKIHYLLTSNTADINVRTYERSNRVEKNIEKGTASIPAASGSPTAIS